MGVPVVPALHITILTSGLGPGGAERVIAQLAGHWCLCGHRVSVVTFDQPEDRVFHPLPPAVAVARLGNTDTGKLAEVVRRTKALRRVLREDPPGLLVSFLTKNNLLAAVASLGLPTKLACCERNNPERQEAHPLWNILLRAAYRQADAIVCQTEGVKRCFPQAVASKLVVIPNPIADFGKSRAAPAGRTIGAVGRLTRQKGFDLLIDAFARVRPDFPGWRLRIWGSGPDQALLQQRISDLALDESVSLEGISPVPGEWIEGTGLFVLSSRYEGFPNVLGEAMAAGLPIVATRCDFGPEEMLVHRESGLLVPNEDPAALAGGLEQLMGDGELRARLADGAAKAVQRYAPAVVFRKWDNLVRELVGAKEQRGHFPAGSPRPLGARVAE